MKIQDFRKEVLLWSMVHRFEEVTDRLLNLGVQLPELSRDYYITVNGVPVCVAEKALMGQSDLPPACAYSTLHDCIRYRNRLKAAFPGAIVAVIAGSCPNDCSFQRTGIRPQVFQAFDDWSSFVQI